MGKPKTLKELVYNFTPEEKEQIAQMVRDVIIAVELNVADAKWKDVPENEFNRLAEERAKASSEASAALADFCDPTLAEFVKIEDAQRLLKARLNWLLKWTAFAEVQKDVNKGTEYRLRIRQWADRLKTVTFAFLFQDAE